MMIMEHLKKANVSASAQDLLSRLMHPDGSKRFTSADALKHPWLVDVQRCNNTHLERTTSDLSPNYMASKKVLLNEADKPKEACKLLTLIKSKDFNLDKIKAVCELNSIDFTIRDEKGNASIHNLCKHFNEGSTNKAFMDQEGNGILKYLVAQGADVNSKGWCLSTPLHFASKAGHNDAVKTLFTLGAVVDTPDANGYTALHYAAWLGSVATVAQLLQENADTTLVTKNNETALQIAEHEKHVHVVDMLKVLPTVSNSNRDAACSTRVCM